MVELVEPEPSRADQAELDRRLIAASWDDDVDRARSLIARGADVNAKDPDGDGVTALEHAQQSGQTAVAGIIRRAD